jgi:hypothetical protein
MVFRAERVFLKVAATVRMKFSPDWVKWAGY